MRHLVSLLCMLIFTVVANGFQYDLIEPSGITSGTVGIERGRLVVYQASGQRTYFSREPRYDSVDGQWIGYFNIDFNRVLRFPRSGSGSLQTADLDHPSPRFRNTQYVVRPNRVGTGPSIFVLPSTVRGYPYLGSPYGGVYGPPLPQSTLIDSRTIPNPPLPPAQVVFGNDGPREIQVGVVDGKNPGGTRSVRIPPGASVKMELDRDAGEKRVAQYRIVTLTGESFTKEVVTDVPPADRYEVVVHEWAIQSVAIDRTGKSPNQIEDINFQGKGIGRFRLPPGPHLQSGTIDVYSAAKNQQNAGAIAPIVPEEDHNDESASPLERAILESQRAAQRRRP